MMRHRRTDPACREYRQPRTRWQRWRYDRGRGHGCPVCYPSSVVQPPTWWPMAAPPLPCADVMRLTQPDGYPDEAHARGTIDALRLQDEWDGIDYLHPIEQRVPWIGFDGGPELFIPPSAHARSAATVELVRQLLDHNQA